MSKQGVCKTIGLNGLVPFEVRVQVTATEGPEAFAVAETNDAAQREVRVRLAAALANVGVLVSGRFALQVVCTRTDNGEQVRYTPAYDLATALATLVAVGQAPEGGGNYTMRYVGELGLSGSVKPVRGVLARCRLAGNCGVVIAEENQAAASLVRLNDVFVLRSLSDYMRGVAMPLVQKRPGQFRPVTVQTGGFQAKTSLEAVQGFCNRHKNVLIVGRAGSGKLTLARRYHELVTQVPSEPGEVVDVNTIHDAAGLVASTVVEHRPFRAPHNTVSEAGLVGTAGRAGEASLAHGGVLLLDELPEFRLSAVQALAATIRRGFAEHRHEGVSVQFPAVPFAIVATAPVCPCGGSHVVCRCTPEAKERYRARLATMADLFNMETYEVPA